ncbi:hypothetical protein DdX_17710 [Ditylenchus destructor]|uniref:Uncharacterized protein n=1 Tax=Ditylenchus destructor TaxID=166010 RepID=A0AAD4MMJ6_9BILA|nr:hypothetical protein DdX_17710 [Ditylenchus destructor]
MVKSIDFALEEEDQDDQINRKDGEESKKDIEESVDEETEKHRDNESKTDKSNLAGKKLELEEKIGSPEKSVKTPVSVMKDLGIDSEKKAYKPNPAENNTPLSSKRRPPNDKSEDNESEGDGESDKGFFSDLTSTAKLMSLISGRPAHDIKLRVVGYTVLYETAKSQRFQVYLANAQNYSMRVTAWNDEARTLSKCVKMHSKIHLNNVDVRKYWKVDGEVNITSSDFEFHFNSPNSKVVRVQVLPSTELSKLNVDYPIPNNFPPFWRVSSCLNGNRERYLSGHAVILQAFESYTFTASKYTSPMSGVYGIVGDKSKVKVAMFIKANYRETEELLEDMAQGVEFHFQDASVCVKGSTLWLSTSYMYCVAISPTSDHNMGLSQDPDDYSEWSFNGSLSAKRKALHLADDNAPDDQDDEPTTSKKRGLYL